MYVYVYIYILYIYIYTHTHLYVRVCVCFFIYHPVSRPPNVFCIWIPAVMIRSCFAAIWSVVGQPQSFTTLRPGSGTRICNYEQRHLQSAAHWPMISQALIWHCKHKYPPFTSTRWKSLDEKEKTRWVTESNVLNQCESWPTADQRREQVARLHLTNQIMDQGVQYWMPFSNPFSGLSDSHIVWRYRARSDRKPHLSSLMASQIPSHSHLAQLHEIQLVSAVRLGKGHRDKSTSSCQKIRHDTPQVFLRAGKGLESCNKSRPEITWVQWQVPLPHPSSNDCLWPQAQGQDACPCV